MRRYEVDRYEIVSVDIERRAGYGKTAYGKKISEDGDALCVVYEEFGEMRHTCGVERNEMVRGRGGLVGGGIR